LKAISNEDPPCPGCCLFDSFLGSLLTTKRELEECFELRVRRRLIDRYVNNQLYENLAHPHLVPGDQVKQKSVLLNPDNENEEIGTVYNSATMLDDDVRPSRSWSVQYSKGRPSRRH
jgi:hypothetical protein